MFGLTQSEWQDLVLSLNTHQSNRRLSPFQAARLIDRALGECKINVLADALGFSGPTMISRIRRLNSLEPQVASIVSWGGGFGRVSMSTVSELLRLGEGAEQTLMRAAATGLTRAEAREAVQIRARSGKSPAAAVEAALRTRPKIERSELIVGQVLGEQARGATQRAGNADATRRLQLELARQHPDIKFRTARINEAFFTILLDPECAQQLRDRIAPRSVEEWVSDAVSK